MPPCELGDAKIACGNWDYGDPAHLTKVPGRSIKASALSLMKECGVKAQHPGLLAGVASFSAGIALHRMRPKKSGPVRRAVAVSSAPAEVYKDHDLQEGRSWLSTFLKAAGAGFVLAGAKRKLQKRSNTMGHLVEMPVKSTEVQLDGTDVAQSTVRAPNTGAPKVSSLPGRIESETGESLGDSEPEVVKVSGKDGDMGASTFPRRDLTCRRAFACAAIICCVNHV